MDNIVRVHCNSCGRETRHSICCSHTTTREDYIESIHTAFEETELLEILQCLGCEEMTVRETWMHETSDEATTSFYPPRISRRTPRWKDKLPQDISAVVDEVYRALQVDSPRLAIMGARTILDLVMRNKLGDIGTFSEKLAALEEQGYVGKKNREFVSAAIEAGSAAIHRGLAPDDANLNLVMDIVESLLESVYVLGAGADRLRQVTPKKVPRVKRID